MATSKKNLTVVPEVETAVVPETPAPAPKAPSKGAQVEALIVKSPKLTRKAIAEKAGCTTSRVSEVLTAMTSGTEAQQKAADTYKTTQEESRVSKKVTKGDFSAGAGGTKGQAIILAAKDKALNRKDLAAEVGCTVGRVGEVIRYLAAHGTVAEKKAIAHLVVAPKTETITEVAAAKE